MSELCGATSVGREGTQSERTSLSWARTGLSFAAIGALIAHHAARRSIAVLVLGLLAVVLGAAVAVWAELRHRSTTAAVSGGRSPAAPRLIALTAVLVTVMELGALALVVTT